MCIPIIFRLFGSFTAKSIENPQQSLNCGCIGLEELTLLTLPAFVLAVATFLYTVTSVRKAKVEVREMRSRLEKLEAAFENGQGGHLRLGQSSTDPDASQ